MILNSFGDSMREEVSETTVPAMDWSNTKNRTPLGLAQELTTVSLPFTLKTGTASPRNHRPAVPNFLSEGAAPSGGRAYQTEIICQHRQDQS